MDKIFWPLLILAMGFLFLAAPGYVEMIFGIIFVALVVIWFRLNEITLSKEVLKEKLALHISNLEAMISEGRDEENITRIQTNDTVTKEEMNDSMDRFAKKLIDIENKMNQMRKTLAAAFASLNDRIKTVEEETFPDEENEYNVSGAPEKA